MIKLPCNTKWNVFIKNNNKCNFTVKYYVWKSKVGILLGKLHWKCENIYYIQQNNACRLTFTVLLKLCV